MNEKGIVKGYNYKRYSIRTKTVVGEIGSITFDVGNWKSY